MSFLGDAFRLDGIKARKDNEQNFKYYKFYWMSGDNDFVPQQTFEEIPVSGGGWSYNFGADFRGEWRVGQKHRYTLENNNYLEIEVLGVVQETVSGLTYWRVTVNVLFNDTINRGNGSSATFSIYVYDIYDDRYDDYLHIGAGITTNELYPPTNMTGKIYLNFMWHYNTGFPSYSEAIGSKREWITIGGSDITPEHTFEETTIPNHIGFDPFLWAGSSGRLQDSDPYSPGDDSDDDGGDGDRDDTDDPVDFPDLPDIDITETGFINLFNPSQTQLNNLANYMWSDAFSLDSFKKIFADPMDCILGLSLVPVHIPNGGNTTVKVGNISTNVEMTKAGRQYIEVKCGSLKISEYWGAYLDYSPYTKIQIYLPYIGYQDLSIDDVMNKTIEVRYHVDILSGSLCAYVKCGNSVLYSYPGQCSISIPITGENFSQMITSIASGIIGVGSKAISGNIGGAVGSMVQSAISVASSKPQIEKSGQLTGMCGMLGIQKPYIVLTRPRQCLPKSQNKFTGYPSFTTTTLNALSGYTEVYEIHLEGIDATGDELSEIESLLKGGVII